MKPNGTILKTPAALVDELHALIAEAEKRIGAAGAELTGDAALGDLRARFDAAQECLADLYADAKKKVVAGARQTDEVIRTHPYESIAIAAGIALVVGVIAGRRFR